MKNLHVQFNKTENINFFFISFSEEKKRENVKLWKSMKMFVLEHIKRTRTKNCSFNNS